MCNVVLAGLFIYVLKDIQQQVLFTWLLMNILLRKHVLIPNLSIVGEISIRSNGVIVVQAKTFSEQSKFPGGMLPE